VYDFSLGIYAFNRVGMGLETGTSAGQRAMVYGWFEFTPVE
jgi:hypothetical protein